RHSCASLTSDCSQRNNPTKVWHTRTKTRQQERLAMTVNYRILDALRRGRTAHENHLIDGLVAGRVSRREFMRHGSVLGLSLPFLGSVAATVGLAGSPRLARAGTPGGTIRIAQNVPAAAIDPVKIADG